MKGEKLKVFQQKQIKYYKLIVLRDKKSKRRIDVFSFLKKYLNFTLKKVCMTYNS